MTSFEAGGVKMGCVRLVTSFEAKQSSPMRATPAESGPTLGAGVRLGVGAVRMGPPRGHPGRREDGSGGAKAAGIAFGATESFTLRFDGAVSNGAVSNGAVLRGAGGVVIDRDACRHVVGQKWPDPCAGKIVRNFVEKQRLTNYQAACNCGFSFYDLRHIYYNYYEITSFEPKGNYRLYECTTT